MGKSMVNIFSCGARCGGKKCGGAFIEGNGYAKSTSDYALDRMSEDLVGAVDKNNERVYSLLR